MNPLLLLTIAGGGLWLLSKRTSTMAPARTPTETPPSKPTTKKPPFSYYTLVKCDEYRGHEFCVWYRPESGMSPVGHGPNVEYDVTIDGGPPVFPRSSGKYFSSVQNAADYARMHIDKIEDPFED